MCALQAAGGPGGQDATAYQLELHQELAELRQQSLSAQRRLCDCQQQLAKSQASVGLFLCRNCAILVILLLNLNAAVQF
jgi:hypothetical protein